MGVAQLRDDFLVANFFAYRLFMLFVFTHYSRSELLLLHSPIMMQRPILLCLFQEGVQINTHSAKITWCVSPVFDALSIVVRLVLEVYSLAILRFNLCKLLFFYSGEWEITPKADYLGICRTLTI